MDFDDLPARDREVEYDTRPSARSPHGSHGTVDEHRLGEPGTPREGSATGRQVDDINASVTALLDAGAQVQQEIKDVGGGKLIAAVRDADSNTIGLIRPA